MAQRPEEVFAELTPQILDYLAIPPDRPANAWRAAMRLLDSPRARSRVSRASVDPHSKTCWPPPDGR